MNKKLKNILSVGAITMLTASSMLSVNALCKSSNTKYVVSRNVYIYVNGIKYKLPLSPECPNIECKPQFKPNNNCNGHITIKPNNNNSNSNTNTNPDTNNNSSDNTTTKPNTNNNSSSNTTTTKPNNNNSNTQTNNNNNNTTNNSNTTAKPEEKPVTTPSTDFSAYQQQVLDLVNAERTKIGLSPLTLDSSLSSVATKKSQDMVNKNYFNHTSPTYGSPFDMMNKFGISYRSAGENIAKGQRTPEEVMNSWMNSSGHRANILNANYTKLGVGIAKDSNGTIYWTQMFIG